MSLYVNIRRLFTLAAIRKTIETAPPLVTTVYDTCFPPAVRIEHDSPVIPVAEVRGIANVIPVVQRGAPSQPIVTESMRADYIEPLPVRAHVPVTAVELNNFKLMGETSKERWAARKTLALRASIRRSIEALAAQAQFNGEINFPMLLSNGAFARYRVSYGSVIQTYAPEKTWDTAGMKLTDVYTQLDDMATLLQEEVAGSIRFLAGRKAYAVLLGLVQAFGSTAKVSVAWDERGINVGGLVVAKMAETYKDPETGAATPKIPEKEIRAVVADSNAFFYGAIDDLDANLQPLPFFAKPIKLEDPSEMRIVGESKPLPAPVPRAVCKAVVVA